MDIEYIKDFVVLAEVGNYLDASDQLFISQSSLTRHIQQLEKDLGVTLFDRTTRKVALNKYGQMFLPYASRIVQIQYEYETAFYNELRNIHSSISIGSIPSMVQYNITDLLIKFKKENTNFTLNVIEAESHELKDMLRQNKCELAFVRETDDTDNEFVRIPYSIDTMVAVIPIDHPLAKSEFIALEQLRNEKFILLPEHSIMHELSLKECRKAGFEPNIVFTGYRGDNLVDMVSKGAGCALLMKRPAVFLSNPNTVLVDIIPSITTKISLFYKKNTELSIAARHFINCLNTK
jgi:DNA-binding transcriptional LysR family regulator